ncbi:PEP-CTERM sorting domain-containing protein [Massilia sp. YIM B04103]|uniref:PEP-CTERM sorting domain-containing protein n=1 Tax=Massilia sp. YIM B04103 TaxID=2963106 RepID=UPI00210C1A55|nr:PEP-CTERM sorting domain-containing protein [Massilia sp. YIM B04103]
MAGTAFAQDINAQAFTLSNAGGWWGDNIKLLSDTNGITTISMGYGPCCSDVIDAGPGRSNGDNALQNFNVNTRAGYRVTGFSVSAKLIGSLSVGEHDGERGEATNRGGFEFTAYQNGTTLLTRRWEQAQLQGTETHLVSGQAVLPSSFSLDILAWQSAYAQGALYYTCNPASCSEHWATSSASLKVTDLVLTVQTAPVPEPETYAMLLGGLAITAFVARRRQRKA